MRIEFDEGFELPLPEVEAYFRTPADWVRLYGLAGRVDDRGHGWIAVPLAGFLFPLVAKTVEHEPGHRVRWVFRGFWKGEGEVRFEPTDAGGTRVRGFEEISVRPLGPLSRLVERLFLDHTFRSIWALGWRRLRRRADERAHRPETSPDDEHEHVRRPAPSPDDAEPSATAGAPLAGR